MSRSKEEAARELIARHFRGEPRLRRIYSIVTAADASDDEPIKLLEVNQAAPDKGQIEFFNFPPSEHFPYRSLVAEISPSQHERVKDGSILLPDGWDISEAREFRRSDVGMPTTRPWLRRRAPRRARRGRAERSSVSAEERRQRAREIFERRARVAGRGGSLKERVGALRVGGEALAELSASVWHWLRS